MKQTVVKRRNSGIKSYLSFIIIGAFILAISIYGGNNYKTLDGSGVAKVVDIVVSQETVTRGDDTEIETVYTQYVDYEVDGVKYENVELGTCGSKRKVGDLVNIVYDTKDPTRVQEKGKALFFICGIGGALSILFGIVQIIKNRVKS